MRQHRRREASDLLEWARTLESHMRPFAEWNLRRVSGTRLISQERDNSDPVGDRLTPRQPWDNGKPQGQERVCRPECGQTCIRAFPDQHVVCARGLGRAERIDAARLYELRALALLD